MPSLCRDCGAADSDSKPAGICAACGGARRVSHAELAELSIAHVDCDAFYAAVEKRDRPELRDCPVIVGGGRRGVVATACYLARRSGVHSAMPMFEARQRCPDAVVVPPDMRRYQEVSGRVFERMHALTPKVESVSIDEAYLDLSGTTGLFGRFPAESLARFAGEVEREIGITISVGLSTNKLLAKIASEQNKPCGFTVIGRQEAAALLGPMPVRVLPGVGPVLEKKLLAGGICKVGDLVQLSPGQLSRRFGGIGLRLAEYARGEDSRPIRGARPAKSISSEVTLERDLSDPAGLQKVLARVAETLAGRLALRGLAGENVTLKLKTADFRLLTRSCSVGRPVCSAGELLRTARPLLEREADGRAFRLVGIGVHKLRAMGKEEELPSLFGPPGGVENPRLRDALREIRERYGADALREGIEELEPTRGSGGADE